MINFTYKRADKIIAASEGIKNALVEDIHISPDAIEVIYNSLDLVSISELKGEAVEWSFDESGKDHFDIISVGSLSRQKNFPLLLKAFSEIRKEVPSRLVILGEGPLKLSLKRSSRSFRLISMLVLPDSKIILTPGWLEQIFLCLHPIGKASGML